MKVFRLPDTCAAILFDIDSTLYTNPEFAQMQLDLPINAMARLRGTTFDKMNAEIAKYREDWARDHAGQETSLGKIFMAMGIGTGRIIRWREDLIVPEQHLARDDRLRSVLEQLTPRFILAAVTNNPSSIGIRTLRTLGVEDLFHAIVGFDAGGVPKPGEEPFMRAAILCGAGPESCVVIGDRYDIDIATPLQLGMGGILVDGVEDVYNLPELLLGE